MRAPYPGVAPSASAAPEGGFMFSSSRAVLICTAVIAAAACTEVPPTAAPPIFGVPPLAPEFSAVAAMLGRPLPRLSPAQRLRFDAGRAVFATVFTPTTGLGPLFNALSCASCHEEPVVGGGGNNDPAEGSEDVEVHATAFHGGQCDDLAALGGPVLRTQPPRALAAALHITAEAIPAAATDSGHRTTPDLFGFGLLDAVPEREILAHADPLDRNGDGISGRPNRTADGRVGRFGRKAQVATLGEFNAGAFVNEMGITSPTEPHEQTIDGAPLPAGVDPTPDPELTQDAVDATTAFVRLLAPPAPLPRTFVEERGRVTFVLIGCAGCHVPALATGFNRVSALNLKIVQAYTDLLLHDMGPDLADICLGKARPAEHRTQPPLGLRVKTALLPQGPASR